MWFAKNRSVSGMGPPSCRLQLFSISKIGLPAVRAQWTKLRPAVNARPLGNVNLRSGSAAVVPIIVLLVMLLRCIEGEELSLVRRRVVDGDIIDRR